MNNTWTMFITSSSCLDSGTYHYTWFSVATARGSRAAEDVIEIVNGFFLAAALLVSPPSA